MPGDPGRVLGKEGDGVSLASLRLDSVRGPVTSWERVAAVAVSLTALLPLPKVDVFTGAVVSAALLLPLMVPLFAKDKNLQRLAVSTLLLGLLAAGTAALVADSGDGIPTWQWAFRPFALMVSVVVLYWSSTKIGISSSVILAIPVPLIFDVITRYGQGNIWKYAASVWVTVGLLVLVHRRGVWWKCAAVALLVVLSAMNDTRGIIAMAAAGLVVEVLSKTATRKLYRLAVSVVGAAILAVGSFQLAVTGALGAGIQRTMVQQTQEGAMSLLRFARPESEGNLAMVLADPLRFLVDDKVSASQAAIIQNSFAEVGRDPGSQYVERGVLYGAELHSVLADFWLHIGFFGIVIAAIFASFFVSIGIKALFSRSPLVGVVIFISLRAIWDLMFSPASDLRFWPLYVLIGLVFFVSERRAGVRSG